MPSCALSNKQSRCLSGLSIFPFDDTILASAVGWLHARRGVRAILEKHPRFRCVQIHLVTSRGTTACHRKLNPSGRAGLAVPADRPMGVVQRREAARPVRLCSQANGRDSPTSGFQCSANGLYSRTFPARGVHLSRRSNADARGRKNRHGDGSAAWRAESVGYATGIRAVGKSRRGFSHG